MVAQTCVCTVSLASDEREARLIRGTLEHLSGAGVPVVVADGGSPPDNEIRALPHVSVVISQQANLVGQVQAAFADRRADASPAAATRPSPGARLQRDGVSDGIAEYELGAERPRHGWLDYIQGVTVALARQGLPIRGFDLRHRIRRAAGRGSVVERRARGQHAASPARPTLSAVKRCALGISSQTVRPSVSPRRDSVAPRFFDVCGRR